MIGHMNDESQNKPSSGGTGSATGSTSASASSFPQFFLSMEPDYSGKTVGSYLIVRKIAEGGMGVVYEATQTTLDRRVALKILNTNIGSRPEFLRRFEREAKAAAALNHPNIMQVYDFIEFEGRHCLIMEFIEGEDLAQNVERNGKYSVSEALGVVEQAAQALKFAVSKSIIHRDIKPSNLMLTTDGRVKVSDLGLAKVLTETSDVTATGDGLGSPHFIAPEQADDARKADHRADIYSLGITLLYLLTGKKPFDGGTPYSVVLAHVSKPLPSGADLGTDLPPEIEGLIQRMAAKSPDDRYPTYDALLTDLLRVRDGFAPEKPLRVAPEKKPVTALWIAAAAALVIGCLGAAWWMFHAKKPAAPVTPVAAVASTVTAPVQPAFTDQRPSLDQGREQFRQRSQQNDQGFPPEEGGPGGPPNDDPQNNRPGPGGPPGMRQSGMGMPMGRPPVPTFIRLASGSPEQMLAEADRFAEQHKTDYREIVDAYQQVVQQAGGAPIAAQVESKLNAWMKTQSDVTQKAIQQYTEKMQAKVKEHKPQEAWSVWKDFPGNLRTRESDEQIRAVIKNNLPDFQPQ